jgi:hypothetical protein
MVNEGKGKKAVRVEQVIDPGIADKRLLILEAEFGGALRVMQRPGSTLSPVLRNAWDHGDLSTLTKNSPARATGALISILGQITSAELRECLDRTSMADGFGNRFLLACVRRSKRLPFGGDLNIEEIQKMAAVVEKALKGAKCVRKMTMSDTAADYWQEIYDELSEGRPGLLGALTARAEAQVVRQGLIYALWEGKNQIELAHLKAARAVWDYCAASAEYIFGDRIGNLIADAILQALKQAERNGMTRTDINNLFSRNVSAGKIGEALAELNRGGFATIQQAPTNTPGRPTETWIATLVKR